MSAISNAHWMSTMSPLRSFSASMQDLIRIDSRNAIGDVASLLFDPARCFRPSAQQLDLIVLSCFSFRNNRCSRASSFYCPFIPEELSGLKVYFMWNCFS